MALVTDEINLTLLTLAIGGAGIYARLSCITAAASKLPERLASLAGGAPYRLLLNKYYVDELYDFLIVRPFTLLLPLVGSASSIPGSSMALVNGCRATAPAVSA